MPTVPIPTIFLERILKTDVKLIELEVDVYGLRRRFYVDLKEDVIDYEEGVADAVLEGVMTYVASLSSKLGEL